MSEVRILPGALLQSLSERQAFYFGREMFCEEAIAFEVSTDGRSGRIDTSLVLPGLELAAVEEAQRRSQSDDDGVVSRWLIDLFSQEN
ncbi:MAG: hypothetical protein AAFY15_02865 [Cyanobacteria bacterium J06648_11]